MQIIVHVTDAQQQQDADSLPPTPLYNLAVLEDMCVLTQHKILAKTITAKPLAEALMLFKVLYHIL